MNCHFAGRQGSTETETSRSGGKAALTMAMACLGAGWLVGCAGLVSPPTPKTPAVEKGQLAASLATVSFGSVAVGTAQTQSVVLVNQGPGAVKVATIVASGSGFTLQPVALPILLASGANFSVNATFAPGAAQSDSGVVTVSSDAVDGTLTVALSGQGTAATKQLSATPNQISFGNVVLGKSSSANVTLANSGNMPVTISGISGATGEFAAAGAPAGTVVNPGQSASLSVVFAPTVAGATSENIAVQSDASPVTVALNGVGIQVNGHSVALIWQGEDGAVGYNVYRQDAVSGDFVKINAAALTGPGFEDLEVQTGSVYGYVVTAVSADGSESPQSDPVWATIPAS